MRTNLRELAGPALFEATFVVGATELDPRYRTAHAWYAFLLASQGRLDEALVEGHTAQELDPLRGEPRFEALVAKMGLSPRS